MSGHRSIPAFSSDDVPDFNPRVPVPAHGLAVKRWTREFLKLDDEAVVTVSELACSDPGCPLIETVNAVSAYSSSSEVDQTRMKFDHETHEDHEARAAIRSLPGIRLLFVAFVFFVVTNPIRFT